MQPCSNPDCLYLHEIGSQEDSFTKDEIVSEYTRYLHLDSFNYFFYHFILLYENAALGNPQSILSGHAWMFEQPVKF